MLATLRGIEPRYPIRQTGIITTIWQGQIWWSPKESNLLPPPTLLWLRFYRPQAGKGSKFCNTLSAMLFDRVRGGKENVCSKAHSILWVYRFNLAVTCPFQLSAQRICFTTTVFTNCVIATVFSSPSPPSLIARCFKCPAGSRSLSHFWATYYGYPK